MNGFFHTKYTIGKTAKGSIIKSGGHDCGLCAFRDRKTCGGENAKVRLCKLMLKDVNWLVLDEPTNHLDVDAKKELKRALKEFRGTVVLVSHEPDFYEDWVTDIWNVEEWTTKIV